MIQNYNNWGTDGTGPLPTGSSSITPAPCKHNFLFLRTYKVWEKEEDKNGYSPLRIIETNDVFYCTCCLEIREIKRR